MGAIIVGAICTLTLFILVISWILNLRKVVPTNEVHVLQRDNKTIIYGKNTKTGNVYYAIPTWIPKYGVSITKLPSTVINLSMKDFFVRDKNMLPFLVDIKAYAVVDDFIPASNRVFTINELKEHLTGTIQSVVTEIFAQENLKDILYKRTKYNDTITDGCISQFEEWGVKPIEKIKLVGLSDAPEFSLIKEVEQKQVEQFKQSI